jgi:hypothetical protein
MNQACLCAVPNPTAATLPLYSNANGSPTTNSFNLTKPSQTTRTTRIRNQPMLHSHTQTHHKWSLSGMTALVTGGTRGIGYKVFNFNAYSFFFL